MITHMDTRGLDSQDGPCYILYGWILSSNNFFVAPELLEVCLYAFQTNGSHVNWTLRLPSD